VALSPPSAPAKLSKRLQERHGRLEQRAADVSPLIGAFLFLQPDRPHEANSTNTFYTASIKGGKIEGARLILLKLRETDGNDLLYYVWVARDDTAIKIIWEWWITFWGVVLKWQRPSD
jgi:hypothetical protein